MSFQTFQMVMSLATEALKAGANPAEDVAEREFHARDILDASPVPMALNDDGGNIVYVNPALTRLLGYRREDVPTLSAWFPLAYPDPAYRAWVREEWERRLSASRLAQAPFEAMDVLVRKADGEFLHLRATATDIVGESAGVHLVTLIDISDLKAQEVALDTQHRRLNDILIGTNVGTWEWNVQTGETVFNERWAEIVGYTLAELQPVSIETWARLVHPDDQRRSTDLLERHFRGECSFYECEARMRHKDGHWVWILDRGKVSAWTADGKPGFMSGTHQDISGRKRAEAELRQQKDELDDLYNRAPFGYHSIDDDGVFLRINDTELGWLGYPREAVVGKRHITDFLTPASVAAFRAEYPKYKATGRTDGLELELVGKDGRITPVLLSRTAICDESGRYLASRSVLADYRLIREQQETLRKTLSVAPIAVRIARFADNRVVMANQAFCKLFKCGEEEAIGLDISQFYVDPQAFAGIRRRLGEGQTVVNQLVELHLPDQPEMPHVWALSSFLVMDYLGEKSVLAWMYDISEREELRRQLEQHRDQLKEQVAERTLSLSIAREAAEAASRLKSTILNNISHEFRTPMNGILGMVSIVRQRLVDPKLKDLLGKAEISANRLMATLTGLIDLAAAESGRLTLDHLPFNVSDLLATLPRHFQEPAHAKGLSLTVGPVAYDPFGPRQFMGDPLRVEQILFELVGNAIKFSDRGGIDVQTVVTRDAAGQSWLNCKVADQGIGISEKHRQEIFEPFKQLDPSSTRAYGGNGVGLALCRRLAMQMGGTIEVASMPMEGSTFTLRIPLHEAAAAPHLSSEEATTALMRRHPRASVLLAEHNKVLKTILAECLESAGLTVLGASDGADAIEMARSAKFDLILLDLVMPETTGIDAAYAIQAMPQYAKTPILAITAQPFEDVREECLRAGFNGHVPVPFTPEVLLNIVLEWLD